MRIFSLLVIGSAVLASTTIAHAQEVDWQKVDEAFGRKPRCPATFTATAFHAPILP